MCLCLGDVALPCFRGAAAQLITVPPCAANWASSAGDAALTSEKRFPLPNRPAPFPLELIVAYPRYTYYDGQILNSSETPAQVTVLPAVSKQSVQTHTVLHRAARQGTPSARCRLGRGRGRGRTCSWLAQLVWRILSCPMLSVGAAAEHTLGCCCTAC